jgi:hypothetical protein
MVQTLQASKVDIRILIDNFGLQFVSDEQFFREWQDDLPELTTSDQAFLDRVKSGYFNLLTYPPLLEKTIQIAIVGPILFLAGFYLPPFHIKAEKSIEISAEDEGVIIRGQLDIVLIKEQFWTMIIESKEASFSLEAGLAQLLAYMMASPHPEKPGFGMIATGGSFSFVKLVRQPFPQYAISKVYELRNPGNDLYDVFRILQRISQL